MKRLLEAARRLHGQMIEWRRDFHRHPELGYEEHRTSAKVADHLRGLGLEVRTGVGRTGVVGLLRGERDGPTILLRADMDALPIPEADKGIDYMSEIEGKAHLCGHDAHTSMLMGAAQILRERGVKRGNVKFMFQPAEEGLAGARAMIEDGVLDNPRVDAAVALHVSPVHPTGRVAVIRGAGWAAADRVIIRIIGRGGHAAAPHQTVDAVAVAAQVITALQQIVSRQTDPLDAAIVTIGRIAGGHAFNAIAPEVLLEGTVRTLVPETQRRIRAAIEAVVQGVTASFGASYEYEYEEGYPVLVNSDEMNELVKQACDATLGPGRWEYGRTSMGGEDFAFVAQRVPSAMFRLGTRNGEKTAYPLHHPMFNLDEDALPIGAALLASMAVHYLENAGPQGENGIHRRP
ncbi:MAG: amidohydrolase [Paenibacillaceae bacterium ZCTH02-B3]|mgnify:CR=1 FL=1|nr:MAG: amidohydrolase [Paenibacillaceae bacterium ZCTH02-B3]